MKSYTDIEQSKKLAEVMTAEKYISDCTRNCSNELCSVEDRYGKTIISYREWLTPDQALRAAEITKEETFEKAWNWIDYNNRNGGCNFDGWEEDFKSYMKGEYV